MSNRTAESLASAALRPDEAEFMAWLKTPDAGQFAATKAFQDGFYAGIKRLLFHWTLIQGEIGDRCGYTNRWCYATEEQATAALAAWNGQGEPTGWTRNPNTGRRRTNGDPSTEYIEW